MKKYTLYWLTGDKEIVKGTDIADAFRRSGYGGGALRALDFWESGESSNWLWDKETRKWKSGESSNWVWDKETRKWK